jgi:hypothetical protein
MRDQGTFTVDNLGKDLITQMILPAFRGSQVMFRILSCNVFMFCFVATIKQGPSQFDEVDSTVEVLELDPDLQAHFLFVRETAREVGFKFSPQELVPGVLFCAAERVLLEV